jgi:tetratricopeptide (TPR) repeat protein
LCEVDASIGRNKMQKATINNLFDMETFSFKGETNHVSLHGAFYQQIASKLIKAVYDTDALTRAGNRLIALAHHALDLRQTDTVEQISQILTSAPLPREYQSIGQYYQVFCLKRRGAIDQARAGFQRLADWPSLPLTFRARALQALGISYSDRGQFDAAMPFFVEAAHAASPGHGNDLWTTINTQLITAISRSVEDDHEGALRHLENLQPLVRMLAPRQPLIRYIYVNSLAVELGELGRLEEARRLSEIAVRSPYARVYTEWQETYDEIVAKMRRASPSVIGGVSWPQESHDVGILPVAVHNVVAMPVVARPVVSLNANAVSPQPGRVIAYHGWQRPTPEQVDALQEIFTSGDLEQMSIADKQTALLNVIYSDNVTHHTLDQLLATAAKVTAKAPAS